MAKNLSVPQMMRVAIGEGWAVVVLPAGPRFCARVWDRDRAHAVDGVHATFGPALREAIARAYWARDRGRFDLGHPPDPGPDREPDRPPSPTLPSPEQLAALLATATPPAA